MDISHEALIDGWSRLQDWADERREAEQIRRRLEGKATEWVRLGKGSGGLLSDVELPEAEHWLASADAADLGFDVTLPELVKASQQAIQHKLAQQVRTADRMRRSLVGLVVILVIAIAAALFAWTQSEKAQNFAEQADAQRIEAQQAEQEAKRLAEAEALARTQSETRRVEAEIARLTSIAQLLLIQAPQQQDVLADERGALMARQAYLLSAAGGRHLQEQVDGVLRKVVGKPHFSSIMLRNGVGAVTFNSDGTRMAFTTARTVELRSFRSPAAGAIVLEGFPRAPGAAETAAYISALAFSPNGKTLLAANADGGWGRWDLDNLQRPMLERPYQPGGIWSAAYSADGRWLALGHKFDEAGIISLAFSSDAMRLATGDVSGAIRLWQWDSLDAPPKVFHAHEGTVNSISFSSDSQQLLSASWNHNSVRLWELGSSTPAFIDLSVPKAFAPWVARFSPDGSMVAASGVGGIVAWKLSELLAEPKVLLSAEDWTTGLAFSPDGKLLAMGSRGLSDIHLQELTHPERSPFALSGHAGLGVRSLAFSLDGKSLASGGRDATVRLWDPVELQKPSILLGRHDDAVLRVRFSPDGNQLASAGQDHSVRLWNIEAPNAVPIILPGHERAVHGLAYSLDGKNLVTSSKGRIRVWDLTHPLNASTTQGNRSMPVVQRAQSQDTLDPSRHGYACSEHRFFRFSLF